MVCPSLLYLSIWVRSLCNSCFFISCYHLFCCSKYQECEVLKIEYFYGNLDIRISTVFFKVDIPVNLKYYEK
jgi:hypothetical protein